MVADAPSSTVNEMVLSRTDVPSYDFAVTLNNDNNMLVISISQKGGHVVYMNYNRNIEAETLVPSYYTDPLPDAVMKSV